MSDNEEVIYEGSDLYKYLIDQGFSDFVTHKPSYNKDDSVVQSYKHNNTDSDNWHPKSYGESKDIITSVSVSDHLKLTSVLHSQLIFKEDIHILESLLSTTQVFSNHLHLYSYVSVGIGGLLLSVLSLPVFRSRVSCYVPIGITVLCSTFSSWLFYQKFLKSNENKQFASHISLLQQMCSNIHRVFQCVKETEIISTGQVSTDNIGVAAYSSLPIGLGFHQSKELGMLPSWKTLPHVRRCLVDVLVMMINMLNEACVSLGKITQPMANYYAGFEVPTEFQTILKSVEETVNSGQCVTLKNIQALNDIYLLVQSEYLKWVALCILNTANEESIRSDCSSRNSLFKMISYLQSKLAYMSSLLIQQYHIRHISAMTLTAQKHPPKNHGKNISHLQVKIHNISLLVLSVLLRIRSLEDRLAEAEGTDPPTKLNVDINSLLASLKDDFTGAIKCYETIYSQFTSEDEVNPPQEEKNEDKTFSEPTSKNTGVLVGVSDFNVNSPDEVFLAISGNNNQEQEHDSDDWLFETKPQIPTNLIHELSNTLKLRKIDFIEREKRALERQGLQDIEDSPETTSSEESSDIETKTNSPTPNKKQGLTKLNKHCSGSEDDEPVDIRRKNSQRYHIAYRKLHAASSSESEKSFSENNFEISPKQQENILNTSSLANMVAMKSQMWKKTEEENYSDG